MQLRDVDSLPTTLTAHQFADALGVGVDLVWQMAREGTSPVAPLKLGRKLVFPTARVLDLLGLDAQRPAEEGGPLPTATTSPTATQVDSCEVSVPAGCDAEASAARLVAVPDA